MRYYYCINNKFKLKLISTTPTEQIYVIVCQHNCAPSISFPAQFLRKKVGRNLINKCRQEIYRNQQTSAGTPQQIHSNKKALQEHRKEFTSIPQKICRNTLSILQEKQCTKCVELQGEYVK